MRGGGIPTSHSLSSPFQTLASSSSQPSSSTLSASNLSSSSSSLFLLSSFRLPNPILFKEGFILVAKNGVCKPIVLRRSLAGRFYLYIYLQFSFSVIDFCHFRGCRLMYECLVFIWRLLDGFLSFFFYLLLLLLCSLTCRYGW